MKPSDSDGLLAPRHAPDNLLIVGALDLYTSGCAAAGIEPQPVDSGRSMVRRSVWRGAYEGAIVTLKHGKETVAIYDVTAERRQQWDDPESRIHWDFERAYTPDQLRAFEPLFAEMKSWWAAQVVQWRESGGGPGSFVVGAGIAVRVLRPRCRKTERQEIIYAPSREAAGASGCWEPFVNEIITRLKAQGVEAHYQPGRLD